MSGEDGKYWTDVDKAQWVLENGKPNYAWTFERVNRTIYRRPSGGSTNVPPWISETREVYALQDEDNKNNFTVIQKEKQ